MDVIIEGLESEGSSYAYVVTQATDGSITFYERLGFVRVGALTARKRQPAAEPTEVSALLQKSLSRSLEQHLPSSVRAPPQPPPRLASHLTRSGAVRGCGFTYCLSAVGDKLERQEKEGAAPPKVAVGGVSTHGIQDGRGGRDCTVRLREAWGARVRPPRFGDAPPCPNLGRADHLSECERSTHPRGACAHAGQGVRPALPQQAAAPEAEGGLDV